MASNNTPNVFVYTGKGQTIPKDVVSVRFHPSVIEVEEEAFRGCGTLEEVVFNVGLKKIYEEAFKGCNRLQSISFPTSLIEIGDSAFEECSRLSDISLHEGIQKLGETAFCDCDSLQHITIPSTITELSDMAFYKCINLREVVLSEGLKKIGYSTFSGCESLNSIALPSSITEIGSTAFSGCINLREVILNSLIEDVGADAFHECSSLEKFKFQSISTRIDNIIKAGQTEVESKVNDIVGFGSMEWRDNELFISSLTASIDQIFIIPSESFTEFMLMNMAIGRNSQWQELKAVFEGIVRLLTYYEMKEATTLFELAFWKAKIDETDDVVNPTSRNPCHRIEVPGPVKDTILHYLYPAEQILDWRQEDGSTSSDDSEDSRSQDDSVSSSSSD